MVTNNSELIIKRKLNRLTKSFGFGLTKQEIILRKLGIKTLKNQKRLTNEKILEFSERNFTVGEDLKIQYNKDRSRLYNLNSYKGFRFKNCLPCNGQRTQTNAGTSKSRRKGRQAPKRFGKSNAEKVLEARAIMKERNEFEMERDKSATYTKQLVLQKIRTKWLREAFLYGNKDEINNYYRFRSRNIIKKLKKRNFRRKNEKIKKTKKKIK